jgi:Type II secretion system (T2SS), protein M subtype b
VRATGPGIWARLGSRDRRAVAMGAALLGVALGVRVAVLPSVRMLADTRELIQRERALLGRERSLLLEVKTHSSRMPAAERALLNEAPRLFPGPDMATASATLVNYLSSRAVQHRVFVQQSVSRPPVGLVSGVAKLQVELRVVGDFEGILALLQDLEGGAKLLSIESVALGQAERLNVGASPRDEEVLGMSAIVSGYVLGDLEVGQEDPPTAVARGGAP